MNMPNMGFQPGGQQQLPSNQRPFVPAGQGYDAAVAAAQGQQQVQQYVHPTQLGQPAQQALPSGMMGAESVSPLSLVPPNVAGQQPRQPQQQPSPQHQLGQPYQYVQPGSQNQQVDPLAQPIYDPRLPAELQGKSFVELARMNQGLRSLHLQQATAPAQPSTPTQQPAQPIVQSTATQAPGQPTPFNWAKPDESIGKIVEDKIGAMETRLAQALQPLQQQGVMQQAQIARNQVALEVPNFQALEPHIFRRLEGIPPADLANPETWRVAARVAIGDLAIAAHQAQGRQQVQPQQVQPQQTPQNPGVPQYQGVFPAQQVPNGGQPMPNINGFQNFFSETPNQGGPGPQGGAQLSQAQRNAAAAMGMSEADYSAWTVGVPARQPAPFSGGFR